MYVRRTPHGVIWVGSDRTGVGSRVEWLLICCCFTIQAKRFLRNFPSFKDALAAIYPELGLQKEKFYTST